MLNQYENCQVLKVFIGILILPPYFEDFFFSVEIDKKKVAHKLEIMKSLFQHAKLDINAAINSTKTNALKNHLHIASIGYTDNQNLNVEIEKYLKVIAKAAKT